MAKRTLYVTKDMRDPIYRTRQLRAGQPLELDGPTARLYVHLGVATEEKPAKAAAAPAAEPAAEPKPKRAPRKRKPKK